MLMIILSFKMLDACLVFNLKPPPLKPVGVKINDPLLKWSVSLSLQPPYPIYCYRAKNATSPLKTNIHARNIEWGTGAKEGRMRTLKKTIAESQKFFFLFFI